MTAIYPQPHTHLESYTIDKYLNLPAALFTCHTEIRQGTCLCYRLDMRIPVSRLLPPSQTSDLSSCLTQCGVCSWTRPVLRFKRVPLKHIYMDTCLYIICVSVLCSERKTMCLDIKAYTPPQTHWAIPDRLHTRYITPLSNSIRYSSQWTPADRSNATQPNPIIR